METQIEKTRIPSGTYMVMWFTNPDLNPNVGNGKVENGISTQFFTYLEDAERLANMLSGNRVILVCTWQNRPPDYNMYWQPVKVYGESFDLNAATVISVDMVEDFKDVDASSKWDVGDERIGTYKQR